MKSNREIYERCLNMNDMRYPPRCREILERMNEIEREREDLPESIIDCVQDARADEGLPPLEGDELAAAIAICDETAEREIALENELDALQMEFYEISGNFPHRRDFPVSWEYPWKSPQN